MLDRSLGSERDAAGEPVLGNTRERRVVAVHLEQDGVRRDEVPDPVTHHDHGVVVRWPRRGGPCRRSPEALPTSGSGRREWASGASSSSSSASAPERRRMLASSTVGASASRPAWATSDATLTGRKRWTAAVEEDEEEHESGAEEEPGHRHSEVGHVLVDAPQQREREGKRPHEHRERRLEHAVAVPEPHVARRERPCRHLDDEDGHGDDEPGQADRSRRPRSSAPSAPYPSSSPTRAARKTDPRARRSRCSARARAARRRGAAPRGCP